MPHMSRNGEQCGAQDFETVPVIFDVVRTDLSLCVVWETKLRQAWIPGYVDISPPTLCRCEADECDQLQVLIKNENPNNILKSQICHRWLGAQIVRSLSLFPILLGFLLNTRHPAMKKVSVLIRGTLS